MQCKIQTVKFNIWTEGNTLHEASSPSHHISLNQAKVNSQLNNLFVITLSLLCVEPSIWAAQVVVQDIICHANSDGSYQVQNVCVKERETFRQTHVLVLTKETDSIQPALIQMGSQRAESPRHQSHFITFLFI